MADASPQDLAAAGDDLEIALRLPDSRARRTRRELYEQLRTAIRAGRLAPGLRMPASRSLALRLGVSRNTVTSVYELLISEGRLVSRHGSGTFVTPGLEPEARRPAALDMTGRLRSIPLEWGRLGFDATAPRRFLLGLPDLAAFPWELWRKLANRTLRAYARGPGRPPGPQGLPALREGIAGHLSFARGVACAADDIIVTSGAQQAFDLLAKTLVHRPGVVVAVEDPGYPPIRQAFITAGAAIAPTPVDDEGLVIEALPASVEVICVTPSHQFPIGVPMSPARRQDLLAFARRTGAVVIEDDYDGEFRFDGRPLEALQTLDDTGQVIYVGTFSKCLFPDLRLGYLVAPAWAREALLGAKQASGGTSVVNQQTLAAFIAEGQLARHVRRMRRTYDRRRRAMFEEIAAAPEGWLAPFPSAAGLHLSLRLPKGTEEERFLAQAAQFGAAAYALSGFALRPNSQEGVVLGYGALSEGDARIGARALVQAARRYGAGVRRNSDRIG
jgi:GntR family transcriptional regulator/MocR family aminotransferase